MSIASNKIIAKSPYTLILNILKIVFDRAKALAANTNPKAI